MSENNCYGYEEKGTMTNDDLRSFTAASFFETSMLIVLKHMHM